MTKQKQFERLTRNYLKKLTDSFAKAFTIGYNYARENKVIVQPSIPESDDTLTRLAKLMAWEFTLRGYKAGGGNE